MGGSVATWDVASPNRLEVTKVCFDNIISAMLSVECMIDSIISAMLFLVNKND